MADSQPQPFFPGSSPGAFSTQELARLVSQMAPNGQLGNYYQPNQVFGPNYPVVTRQLPPIGAYEMQQMMMNRGTPYNAAFSAPQPIPILGSGSMLQQMGNQMLTGVIGGGLDRLLPGMGLKDLIGYIPFQGTGNLSNFEWHQSRIRMDLSRQYVEDLVATHPYNNYTNNPQAHGFLRTTMMPQMQSAFVEAYRGFGTAFGGNIDNKLKGVGQIIHGVTQGMTHSSGIGFDVYKTRGLSMEEILKGIDSAGTLGMFGMSESEIVNMSNQARLGQFSAIGAKAQGIANLITQGREFFGKDKGIKETFSLMKDYLGESGTSDVATASSRLNEIKAVANVLNTDKMALLEYARAMKQVAENAGIVGKGQHSAIMGAILSVDAEAKVQTMNAPSGVTAINATEISARRQEMMGRYLGSRSTRESEVLENVLAGMDPSQRMNTRIRVGGRSTTLEQAHQYIQTWSKAIAEGYDTPEGKKRLSKEEISGFMKYMEDLTKGFASSTDSSLVGAQNDFGVRVTNYDPGLEAASRVAGGSYGIKGALQAAGANNTAYLRREAAIDKYTKEKGVGWLRNTINELDKKGFATTLAHSTPEQSVRALMGHLNINEKEAQRIYGHIVGAVQGDRRQGETFEDVSRIFAEAGAVNDTTNKTLIEKQQEKEKIAGQMDAMDKLAPPQTGITGSAMRIMDEVLRDPNLKDARGNLQVSDALKKAIGTVLKGPHEVGKDIADFDVSKGAGGTYGIQKVIEDIAQVDKSSLSAETKSKMIEDIRGKYLKSLNDKNKASSDVVPDNSKGGTDSNKELLDKLVEALSKFVASMENMLRNPGNKADGVN